MDRHTANKDLVGRVRRALYDFDADHLRTALESAFAADAEIKLAFPFEDVGGPLDWMGDVFEPLQHAWPDLERRDTIVISGPTDEGHDWVGCAGYYTGTFSASWLDIPPTNRQTAMRFHEFFRVVEGRVVEIQAVWDIPEVMMQADAWPMGPSLGREWHVPGPATQDGIVPGPRNDEVSNESQRLVIDMLSDMVRHPAEPPEAMHLDKYWHPHMSWYGPSGIGTARGIDGFRRHHQIPFLSAMPDRRGGYDGAGHFFADGAYVGVTGWPGMAMTLTGGGWLGIAPTGQELTMRSLDFWRVERGLIRENWVLIDLLSIWDQVGVDVFERVRELTAGRPIN